MTVPTRILVVDDDEGLRSVLANVLTKHGYEVQVAQNGRQALDLYDVESPEIVLLDIIMPVKDGVETIMALRQRARRPRVIVMSGGGHIAAQVYLALAKACHIDLALEKPFSISDLLSAIHQLQSQGGRGGDE